MASGDVELRDEVLITGAVAKLLFGDVVPGDEALGDEAPALIRPCNLACDESTESVDESGVAIAGLTSAGVASAGAASDRAAFAGVVFDGVASA